MEAYKLLEEWKQFNMVLRKRNVPVRIIEDAFQELLRSNFFYNKKRESKLVEEIKENKEEI